MTRRGEEKMAPEKYIDLLKNYLKGEIEIKVLSEIVNNRLLELREQSQELSDEEKFLSGIELIIEEIKDGFRTRVDLEEYIKASLIPEIPVFFLEGNTENRSGVEVRIVKTGSANKEMDITTFIPDHVVDYRFQLSFQ
jgi:hypothetical protein